MEISIRKICESDTKYLYELLFDDDIRKFCLSQKKVTYEQHCEYWKKRLNNPENKDYMILYSDSIGCIRINFDGTISIAIKKEFQGKGYGAIALKLAIEQSKLKEYTANIRPKNVVSKKVFKKLGFQKKYEVYKLINDQ